MGLNPSGEGVDRNGANLAADHDVVHNCERCRPPQGSVNRETREWPDFAQQRGGVEPWCPAVDAAEPSGGQRRSEGRKVPPLFSSILLIFRNEKPDL